MVKNMTSKCLKNAKFYFLCFLLKKIEVNRYPNRRKSPRITGCGWLQSWVKISIFLPIWGITKEILKESAETLKKAKNITRSQTTKNIDIYSQSVMFLNPWRSNLYYWNFILTLLSSWKHFHMKSFEKSFTK